MWEIGLLWKDDKSYIPNSRTNALHRLRLLERKLDRDTNHAKMYISEMDRLINNGFAVRANNAPKGRTWYLPHFGVRNKNKPDKVRLVFDAVAKSESGSFNDLLLAGPDLLKSLLGVHMRFWQNPFAVKET